jgi:uncharacterized damage-inducible protein DinB
MKELTKFSIAVRESTLKRLRAVPAGFENWRLDKDSMSIADLAQHIIDCDHALIKAYQTKSLGPNLGMAHSVDIKKENDMQKLLENLEETKNKRAIFIEGLEQEDYLEIIKAVRKSGKEQITLELLIYKILDHEIHHRGQLSVYLKMINKKER